MARYPKDLLTLIAYFKKLPGVGRKTAERFAFHLLDLPDADLKGFGESVSQIKERIDHCNTCGLMLYEGKCPACERPVRDESVMCVVASARDALAIEETSLYKGLFHVIGGLISPLDGMAPENLRLQKLHERTEQLPIQEIILAFDSTLEGDATALYLKKMFTSSEKKVSRLALGLPMGSSLDFIDEGTLSRALLGRQMI